MSLNNTVEQLCNRILFPEPTVPIRGHHLPKQFGPRKNLNNLFEEIVPEVNDDKVSVYLRIKPVEQADELNAGDVLQISDSKTLLFRPPKDYKTLNQGRIRADSVKFTFSHIYGPEVSQKKLFDTCVFPQVQKFLNGYSCLLFSYGTTNAGKTFTILGKLSQPGIIPRSLFLVFSSIKGKLSDSMRYKPDMVSSVIRLDDVSVGREKMFKDYIMNSFDERYPDYDPKRDICSSSKYSSNAYRQMEQVMEHPVVTLDEDGYRYSVWVSFVEIYNEAVHDLLEPLSIGGKRTQLKLAYDKEQCTYVKGVHQVCVMSAEEAYKVLILGKKNLRVAGTNLNVSSSRSHCIFTIKLVKYDDNDDPKFAEISSFSICDLAGAERQKKTLNAGDRLKESQNINLSLHTLSRCFDTLRSNQVRNEKLRIPYRDSKLTQLFQKALSGKHGDKIIMIVNVNPLPILCNETYNVLKSSAVAHQLLNQPSNQTRQLKVSRFSQLIKKYPKGFVPWCEAITEEEPITEYQSDNTSRDSAISMCYDEINRLQRELRQEKSQISLFKEEIESLESAIILRQEELNAAEEEKKSICEEFMGMLREKDEKWKKRMDKMEALWDEHFQRKKAYYEDKIKDLMELIPDEEFSRAEEPESLSKYNELKEEYNDLRDEYNELKTAFESLKINLISIEEENQKLKLDLDAAKEQLTQVRKETTQRKSITNWTTEIQKKDNTIRELDKLLNEAKDDLIATEEEKNDLLKKLQQEKENNQYYSNIVEQKDNNIEDLENQLEKMEYDVLSREQILCKSEAKLDEEKAKNEKLNEDNKILVAENKRLLKEHERTLAALQEKHVFLEECNVANKRLTEQIESILSKSKSELYEINREKDYLLELVEKSRAKIDDLEKGKLSESLKTFTSDEYNVLQNEVTTLQQMLNTKEKEVQDLKAEIATAQLAKLAPFSIPSIPVGLEDSGNNLQDRVSETNSNYYSFEEQSLKAAEEIKNEKRSRQFKESVSEKTILKNQIYELKTDNAYLKKNVEQLETELKEFRKVRDMHVSPSPCKKYHLRTRTVSKSRTRMSDDENYCPSRSVQKSVRRTRAKKADVEDNAKLVQPILRDSSNESRGRRKLFNEDSEVKTVTEPIEATLTNIVMSPRSSFRENLKKCKKRLN